MAPTWDVPVLLALDTAPNYAVSGLFFYNLCMVLYYEHPWSSMTKGLSTKHSFSVFQSKACNERKKVEVFTLEPQEM